MVRTAHLLPALSLTLLGASSSEAQQARLHSLPACPAPALDTTGWRRVYSADSALSVLVPPAFRPDSAEVGRIDGWTAASGASFTLGLTALVSVSPSHGAPFLADPSSTWIAPSDTVGRGSDQLVVRDHSACREGVGRASALIEAGLVTGGWSDRNTQRRVSATFYRAWLGPYAQFSAQASTAAEQREFLVAARTIRIHRAPPRWPG